MFPTFVHEEYPQMVTFVEKVFEYMDKAGNQYDIVSNLLAYNDVDTTLDQFEFAFRNQYLATFPDVLAADVDLLVKNIRSFYLNRGTEQSYRFLFGALFDSTVNFKYPKFNILRASDGLWFTPQYLVISDADHNIPPLKPDLTEYGVFNLVDRFITGTQSGAVAFVDGFNTLSSVGLTYGGSGAPLAISTVESEGAFIPGEQILIGNTIVQNGSFDQDLAFWTIHPAGSQGFSTVDNKLVIEQPFGNIKIRRVSQQIDVEPGDNYYLRFTLSAADAAQTRITVGYAPGGIDLYASPNLGLSAPYSETVSILPVGAGHTSLYVTIWNEMGLANETCTWDGISLVKNTDFGNNAILIVADKAREDFTDLSFNDLNPDTITSAIADFTVLVNPADTITVVDTVSNDGAYLVDTVVPLTITLDAGETLATEGPVAGYMLKDESGVLTGESKWKDLRGMISEGDFTNDLEIVLQDGDYYQDFSYEITSSISIDRFESIVKDLVHPAGFKLFADVVERDGLVTYALRECIYTDLAIDGPSKTITRGATDGRPFNSIWRKGDMLTIDLNSPGNNGQWVVDTVGITTLVLVSAFSLATENFTDTPIKLGTGVGIISHSDAAGTPGEFGAYPDESLSFSFEDPLGIHESYYTTLEFDGVTMVRGGSDGKPFDQWLIEGQYFQLGRMFEPEHRGRYRAGTVTATSVTADTSMRSFPTHSYSGILVKVLRGIIPHGAGTWLTVTFDIDWEITAGFGTTWEIVEARRETDARTQAEWAGLIIQDFKNKATSRFGFIDQWEIDVVPFVPPSSNDPNIVWDYYEPALASIIEYQVSASKNLYFYEGSNLQEGPVYDSSGSTAYNSESFYAQKVIADAVTPFGTGEFLTKWEKGTLYAGDWDVTFTANYTTGQEGIWSDLFRFNYQVDSDNSPSQGIQHYDIEIYVATDDGFGVPVPGSETYKIVTFYALGSTTDWVLRDTFTDTAGTLLAAHTPNGPENFVPGTWADVTNALEHDVSGRVTGTIAGENSAVIDAGHTDVEIQLHVDFQDETNAVGIGARYNSAGTYGYHLELSQEAYDPVLTLYEEWNGTRTIVDQNTLFGEGANGIIGISDCFLWMTTDGADIYGEFFCGQNNQRVYRVHYNNAHDVPWWDTETFVMIRGDGVNANWMEEFNIGDASLTTGRPRTAVLHSDYPPQPEGFVMNVMPNGSFKLELPEDDGVTPYVYNFDVDWGDGTTDTITSFNQTEVTHTYPAGATDRYPISISGTLPTLYYPGTAHRSKIREIKQWGNIQWQSLAGSFGYCNNLQCIARDAPDLTQCVSVASMFNECVNLTGVGGFLNWDFSTSPITTLWEMFYNCDNLNCDLDTWNVSTIEDFYRTFAYCINFNGNIDNWDVTGATGALGFHEMFYVCNAFNRDLSSWDVSGAKSMFRMFSYCSVFNQDMFGTWDTSSCTTMGSMFNECHAFNQPSVNSLNTALVVDMQQMFNETWVFNQPITNFVTTNVTTMNYMFAGSAFNQSLSHFNTANVDDMGGMFFDANIFDQDISGWNVTKVDNFKNMFRSAAAFNQPLNAWTINTTTPVNMEGMFRLTPLFDQPLNLWDTSAVTDMRYMFDTAGAFNSSLAGWDVTDVLYFNGMFDTATLFNQPINDWTLGTGAINMGDMFRNADAFDQPLNSWDVSTVTSMYGMFASTAIFNSSLSAWTLTNCTDMRYMFSFTTLFDQPIDNWTLSTSEKQMDGMFKSAAAFNQSLNSWDVTNVVDFSEMFMDSVLFNGNITGWLSSASTPATVSMLRMFEDADAFNQAIGSWNTSKVTNMNQMFQNTTVFDQDISGWNVAAVTNMANMFYAAPFNQDIGGWDVSNVATISQFLGASTAFSTANYDLLLAGWSLLTLTPSLTIDVNATYTISTSQAAWDIIDTSPNLWTINDLGGI